MFLGKKVRCRCMLLHKRRASLVGFNPMMVIWAIV